MIHKLKKLGLTDKEASIYMALFELGSAVVTSIAKRADINRSTAYVLLNSLSRRGLVSVFERRGVQYYSPISPEKLVHIAEAQFKQAEELVKIGNELVLDLAKISNISLVEKKIKLNLYEGNEASKIVSKELSLTKDLVRSYVSGDIASNVFADEYRNFEDNLLKRSGKSRLMLSDSSSLREKLRKGEVGKKQEIFLAPESDSSHILSVSENKVFFISPDEKTSFTIESGKFAQAIRHLYDMAIQKTRQWNVEPEIKRAGVKKEEILVKAENRFWSGKQS